MKDRCDKCGRKAPDHIPGWPRPNAYQGHLGDGWFCGMDIEGETLTCPECMANPPSITVATDAIKLPPPEKAVASPLDIDEPGVREGYAGVRDNKSATMTGREAADAMRRELAMDRCQTCGRKAPPEVAAFVPRPQSAGYCGDWQYGADKVRCPDCTWAAHHPDEPFPFRCCGNCAHALDDEYGWLCNAPPIAAISQFGQRPAVRQFACCERWEKFKMPEVT